MAWLPFQKSKLIFPYVLYMSLVIVLFATKLTDFERKKLKMYRVEKLNEADKIK